MPSEASMATAFRFWPIGWNNVRLEIIGSKGQLNLDLSLPIVSSKVF